MSDSRAGVDEYPVDTTKHMAGIGRLFESSVHRRRFYQGLVFWCVFSCAAVLIRGVRWHDTLEHAQILLGYTSYPRDHPLFIFYRNVYSLQTYSSAFVLWLTQRPVVLCAFRNVLILLSTTVPCYLLTFLFARKVVFAHAAVLLTLAGVLLAYSCSFPMQTWPTLYAYGHIGTGFALTSLALILCGNWRSGFLLAGLMPCLHMGQTPPMLGFMALFIVAGWFQGRREQVRTALKWALLGLSICGLFWVVKLPWRVPLPTEGPYFSLADADDIWRGFVSDFDLHRGIPTSKGHVTLAGMLLLGLAAARSEWRKEGAWGPKVWLLAYVAVIAAIAWTTMFIHLALGSRMPFVMIAWMPYRLINQAAPILLALSMGILARTRDPDSPRTVVPFATIAAALLFCIVHPWLGHVVGDSLYTRYFAGAAWVFMGLWGASCGLLVMTMRGDRRFLVPWSVAALAAYLVWAYIHRFDALCFASGFSAAWGVAACERWAVASGAKRWVAARGPWILAGLCVVLGILLVHTQWRNRQHLPMSEFDRALVQYLDEQGEGDAMIAIHPWDFSFQARTGHAVLAEPATPVSCINYMPALGPAVDKIYGDLYGMRFGFIAREAPDYEERPWATVWADRSLAQWQVLGKEYDFHYVVAPRIVPIDLPVAIAGETYTLHRIPADEEL